MTDLMQLDISDIRIVRQMYESKLLEMDKKLANTMQTEVVEITHALELLKLSYNDVFGLQ